MVVLVQWANQRAIKALVVHHACLARLAWATGATTAWEEQVAKPSQWKIFNL